MNMDFCAKKCNGKRNIVDFCACKSNTNVKYVKLQTGGNDPSISERMKYAKYVSASSSRAVSAKTTNMGFSMNMF
jgi:hypothetical protein